MVLERSEERMVRDPDQGFGSMSMTGLRNIAMSEPGDVSLDPYEIPQLLAGMASLVHGG